jgi:hypothetical protein
VSDLRFDGRLFWWLNQAPLSGSPEDLCCAQDCRKVSPEEEIPLILWNDAGHESRIHWECAQRLGLFDKLVKR